VKLPSFQVPAVLRRDGVQRAIKAALALGTMGYLVYLVEPSEIAASVAEAHHGYLAAAAALLPANLLLEAAVWRRILTVVVPRASWRNALGALLCGFALGLFTPARSGDFAGRALYFERGDRWAIAATVLVQRFLDMWAAVSAGTGALVWALLTGRLGESGVGGEVWMGLCVAGAGTSLALALLLLWPRRSARWVRRLIPSERVRRHLDFLGRLGTGRMTSAALGAAARFGVYATQFVLLARAFSPDAPVGLLYGGVGLIFFAKHLIPSLTLMDVGIREGAAVFFLSTQLGLPQATAFNAAFFLFLLNLVAPAALGAPLLLRLRFEQEEPPEHEESNGREDDPPARASPPAAEEERPTRRAIE